MLEPGRGHPTDDMHGLQRRLERERAARHAAEAIAENGLRELYAKKEQLELLRRMAVAATESRSIEEVLHLSLSQVCETTGWPLGHAYLVTSSSESRGLSPTAIWYGAESCAFRSFKDSTESLKLGSGIGLPGRVLATGEPAYVTDISEDESCPRRRVARQAKIVAAFAFPVKVQSEVVAVLEFFSHKSTVPDSFFLQLMAEIGTQLGRVVKRRRTEDQLIHDALHDPLTKLPNRSLFVKQLTQAIKFNKLLPERCFVVIFIDLDRFKIVNDSLGHHVGDELLVEVAARLSTCVRYGRFPSAQSSTSAQSSDLLARLGGDEFTILVRDLCDVSTPVHVANRVKEALALPFLIASHELYLTASIGIAWSATTYTSPDEVMRDADLAMYRAKVQGGGRYEVYDRSMYTEALDRLQTEAKIRNGLQHDQFILHYQPIISLRSLRIVGFEALVRWRQTDSQLIYPDKFIGVAETTGLIIPLGELVLRKACKALHRWQIMFPQDSPLTMSVNLSAKQFSQPNLVDVVTSIIEESEINPESVRLEITESVTMGDADRTVNILAELKRFGLRFSIDDFGTGFSSLSYLSRFPLHTLKIDRTFVSRMEEDNESLAIVKTIVNLAHGLGMEVVAEGAESAAHIAHLTSLDCDFAQGYFYSKPLSENDVCTLLENRLTFESALRVPITDSLPHEHSSAIDTPSPIPRIKSARRRMKRLSAKCR